MLVPAKNASWSDPFQTSGNMKAVNDIAAAFGVEALSIECLYWRWESTGRVLPSQMTGNKFVDFFTKMRDYTPETKIKITNEGDFKSDYVSCNDGTI